MFFDTLPYLPPLEEQLSELGIGGTGERSGQQRVVIFESRVWHAEEVSNTARPPTEFDSQRVFYSCRERLSSEEPLRQAVRAALTLQVD